MGKGGVAVILVMLSMPCLAQVYTYIDAEGNRVFTDSPPGKARVSTVELTPITPMNPAQGTPTWRRKPEAPASVTPVYQSLRIILPEPDATINDNNGNLVVTAVSEPALRRDHYFQLLLDDKPYGGPSKSPVFSITDLDRGTHQLAVQIVAEGNTGTIVERTPGQPFHMRRYAVNGPTGKDAQQQTGKPSKAKRLHYAPTRQQGYQPKVKKGFAPAYQPIYRRNNQGNYTNNGKPADYRAK